jgi:hypothetical protein
LAIITIKGSFVMVKNTVKAGFYMVMEAIMKECLKTTQFMGKGNITIKTTTGKENGKMDICRVKEDN